MNFLQKYMADNFHEEDYSYQAVCKSFNKHFPNSSIDEINLIKVRDEHDPLIVFMLGNEKICFNTDRSCEKCGIDCYWFTVNTIKLSTNIISDGDMSLLENSKNDIEYELYPFEQGDELTLEELGFDKDTIGEPTYFETEEDIPWNNLKVRIGDNGDGITYSVYKNEIIISGICDKSYSLQEGDSFSAYYQCDNMLIIRNCGDVSSVVVIKKNMKMSNIFYEKPTDFDDSSIDWAVQFKMIIGGSMHTLKFQTAELQERWKNTIWKNQGDILQDFTWKICEGEETHVWYFVSEEERDKY